jgi:hypothetical protein
MKNRKAHLLYCLMGLLALPMPLSEIQANDETPARQSAPSPSESERRTAEILDSTSGIGELVDIRKTVPARQPPAHFANDRRL